MPRALAILNCSQVVTLAGPPRPRVGPEMCELGIVENGAVLAIGGLIRAVGTRDAVEPQIPDDAAVVDAGGRALLPGFVDAHTHLVFAGNRVREFELRSAGATYEEIAAHGGGIVSTVRQTRNAPVTQLIEAGRRHMRWMLASGTTTVEAKSGYGLTVSDEEKLLQAATDLGFDGPAEVVTTVLAAHAVPTEFAGRPAEYIERVAIPTLQRAHETGLAEFADAFVEESYFDEEMLRPYFEEATRLGLPLRLHVDQLKNSGGAQLAARWRAKTADHLEHTDEAGMDALCEAGTMPVLLPGSVYGLGKSKYPQARTMIEKGLPVVLATDFNPGSSPVASMPLVLSLACTQMRISPAEAIVAATINAAYSLDRGHDRGSIEPGKRADLVLHEVEDFREIPYWVGRNTVSRVWVNGDEVSK